MNIYYINKMEVIDIHILESLNLNSEIGLCLKLYGEIDNLLQVREYYETVKHTFVFDSLDDYKFRSESIFIRISSLCKLIMSIIDVISDKEIAYLIDDQSFFIDMNEIFKQYNSYCVRVNTAKESYMLE